MTDNSDPQGSAVRGETCANDRETPNFGALYKSHGFA
jgi:hypothetical protein